MIDLGQFSKDGYAFVPRLIDDDLIEFWLSELAKVKASNAVKQRGGKAFGIRRLLCHMPAVSLFAESEIMLNLVSPLFTSPPKVVRGIYFDKTPDANWKVPWHQDVMIAVREKIETPHFSAWSVKAGIAHVQPPSEILANIVAVRIHLDAANELNGALRILPGTHQIGILDDAQIQHYKSTLCEVSCAVARGDALLMRPLLLHASSVGLAPSHRRILHLEYSAHELPNGLAWYGS